MARIRISTTVDSDLLEQARQARATATDAELVDLFLRDRLDLSSLVSERLRLEDVNHAFALMKDGKVSRSVLEISAV